MADSSEKVPYRGLNKTFKGVCRVQQQCFREPRTMDVRTTPCHLIADHFAVYIDGGLLAMSVTLEDAEMLVAEYVGTIQPYRNASIRIARKAAQ